MTHYVYKWRHVSSGREYIGKGTRRRAWSHTSGKKLSLLGRAMRKYGQAAFELEILASGLDNKTACCVLRDEYRARVG